jgi:biopolymer transport protein ExbD
MGMQLGRSGGVKNDINVTPLIDVVLVLLIIFLVTMPIMMRTITVEVPPACGHCVSTGAPLEIMVRADLSVTLKDGGKETTVAGTELAAALRRAVEARQLDRAVFVDVEDPVPWRDTVAAMDTIRGVAEKIPGEPVSVALKVRP